MDKSDAIDAHRGDTSEYDRQAAQWGWNPGVFLGLMWPFLKPGQTVLDVGTGTGLCAEPFHEAGLTVHGFDSSEEMLAVCREKRIAQDLKVHDIRDIPWPYPDACFDHLICGGVLHFFGDLSPFLSEAARLLVTGGAFGFTVSAIRPEDGVDAQLGYSSLRDRASGTDIYKHRDSYLLNLFSVAGLVLARKLFLLASLNPDTGEEHFATLFVAVKSADKCMNRE